MKLTLIAFIVICTSQISYGQDAGMWHKLFGYDGRSPRRAVALDKYNTADQINEYLDFLAKSYPRLVDVKTIGRTYEGREIKAVHIYNKDLPVKPGILIDAGIHAREWISPCVALYTLHQLVERYESRRNLTDSIDWHIIPLLNPDGYSYSMKEDRLWRKNRTPSNKNKRCPGVDLNRNFGVHFGGGGTSGDPCSETYRGVEAFSEPETRALRDYALEQKNINLYLTLHSFGKYFLYPWGFTELLPRDWKDLDKLARQAENALNSVYGTHYEVGSSTNLLGVAAGGSDDWMKARAGVKYSYTVELPGGGNYGFDLPAENIPQVTKETFEAIRRMAISIASMGR